MGGALKTLHFTVTVWVVNMVGFLLLLAAMIRYLWRPMNEVFENRRHRIEQQQDETEKALTAAKSQLDSAQTQVADLQKEAAAHRDQTVKAAQAQAEKIVQDARDEAARVREQAQQEADTLKARALEAVKRDAAGLAGGMAERLLSSLLDEERQKVVLEAALKDLEDLVAKEEPN